MMRDITLRSLIYRFLNSLGTATLLIVLIPLESGGLNPSMHEEVPDEEAISQRDSLSLGGRGSGTRSLADLLDVGPMVYLLGCNGRKDGFVMLIC
jgi:hypothetical protein